MNRIGILPSEPDSDAAARLRLRRQQAYAAQLEAQVAEQVAARRREKEERIAQREQGFSMPASTTTAPPPADHHAAAAHSDFHNRYGALQEKQRELVEKLRQHRDGATAATTTTRGADSATGSGSSAHLSARELARKYAQELDAAKATEAPPPLPAPAGRRASLSNVNEADEHDTQHHSRRRSSIDDGEYARGGGGGGRIAPNYRELDFQRQQRDEEREREREEQGSNHIRRYDAGMERTLVRPVSNNHPRHASRSPPPPPPAEDRRRRQHDHDEDESHEHERERRSRPPPPSYDDDRAREEYYERARAARGRQYSPPPRERERERERDREHERGEHYPPPPAADEDRHRRRQEQPERAEERYTQERPPRRRWSPPPPAAAAAPSSAQQQFSSPSLAAPSSNHGNGSSSRPSSFARPSHANWTSPSGAFASESSVAAARLRAAEEKIRLREALQAQIAEKEAAKRAEEQRQKDEEEREKRQLEERDRKEKEEQQRILRLAEQKLEQHEQLQRQQQQQLQQQQQQDQSRSSRGRRGKGRVDEDEQHGSSRNDDDDRRRRRGDEGEYESWHDETAQHRNGAGMRSDRRQQEYVDQHEHPSHRDGRRGSHTQGRERSRTPEDAPPPREEYHHSQRSPRRGNSRGRQRDEDLRDDGDQRRRYEDERGHPPARSRDHTDGDRLSHQEEERDARGRREGGGRGRSPTVLDPEAPIASVLRGQSERSHLGSDMVSSARGDRNVDVRRAVVAHALEHDLSAQQDEHISRAQRRKEEEERFERQEEARIERERAELAKRDQEELAREERQRHPQQQQPFSPPSHVQQQRQPYEERERRAYSPSRYSSSSPPRQQHQQQQQRSARADDRVSARTHEQTRPRQDGSASPPRQVSSRSGGRRSAASTHRSGQGRQQAPQLTESTIGLLHMEADARARMEATQAELNARQAQAHARAEAQARVNQHHALDESEEAGGWRGGVGGHPQSQQPQRFSSGSGNDRHHPDVPPLHYHVDNGEDGIDHHNYNDTDAAYGGAAHPPQLSPQRSSSPVHTTRSYNAGGRGGVPLAPSSSSARGSGYRSQGIHPQMEQSLRSSSHLQNLLSLHARATALSTDGVPSSPSTTVARLNSLSALRHEAPLLEEEPEVDAVRERSLPASPSRGGSSGGRIALVSPRGILKERSVFVFPDGRMTNSLRPSTAAPASSSPSLARAASDDNRGGTRIPSGASGLRDDYDATGSFGVEVAAGAPAVTSSSAADGGVRASWRSPPPSARGRAPQQVGNASSMFTSSFASPNAASAAATNAAAGATNGSARAAPSSSSFDARHSVPAVRSSISSSNIGVARVAAADAVAVAAGWSAFSPAPPQAQPTDQEGAAEAHDLQTQQYSQQQTPAHATPQMRHQLPMQQQRAQQLQSPSYQSTLSPRNHVTPGNVGGTPLTARGTPLQPHGQQQFVRPSTPGSMHVIHSPSASHIPSHIPSHLGRVLVPPSPRAGLGGLYAPEPEFNLAGSVQFE